MNQMTLRSGVVLLLALLTLLGFSLALLAPIPQDPGYHRFADTRALFGIPNFSNVVSNLVFILVGAIGLSRVDRMRRHGGFVCVADARPYRLFFAALVLIGVGSAFYHWEPGNESLFWDRLPIAVALMALFSAVIADRINARAGNGWLLCLLVFVGCASLVYWIWSESQGHGDLRFYALVQFYPLLALPLILVLFRQHRYTTSSAIGLILLCYVLAKLCEHFDRQIYSLLEQSVSGHTLKHLVAASAALVVVRMLAAQDNAGKEGAATKQSDAARQRIVR